MSPAPVAVDRQVELCKQSVQSTGAPLSERMELEEKCEEAATGDQEALREANRAICRRFVGEAVPAGSGREQALEACDNAAEPPPPTP